MGLRDSPLAAAAGRAGLMMFGEADLRRAVARYLAKRELMERDLVFVHLPDGSAVDPGCRRMARAATAHRPEPRPVLAPRRDMGTTIVPPVRSVVNSDARPVARPGTRPAARAVSRPIVRLGAPHFIIWSKDRVLQVELKTTRGRLLEIERAFGNALNTLGHVYHVLRAETPRHAVELVQDLLP